MPSLIWFPVASGIVTLLLTASFAIPAITVFRGATRENLPPMGYVLTGCYYLLSYFIVIFFNTGLVAAANENLQGRQAGFSEGLSMAVKRLPAILGWTLIAATVGTVLRMISENVGVVGSIVVALFGAAWNLLTFFVVPGIVIDQGGPVTALKKSATMLKSTWGENLIGNAGIGLVTGFLCLVPIVPFILICMTGIPALIIGAIITSLLYWLALAVISSSLSGVFQTALYAYAKTGELPNGFSQEAITGAFIVKPSMKDKFRGFGR